MPPGSRSKLYRAALNLKAEPAVLARIAAQCRAFQTLEAHARNLTSRLEISLSRSRDLVRACVDAELLETAGRLLPARRCRDARSSVGLVAVCTRGRPELAASRADEVLARAARRGRRLELAVFDSTPQREARERLKARLRRASRRWGLPVTYCGPEERAAYAESLARAGAPRRSAGSSLGAQAVSGPDYGANRNLASLHGLGGLLVFLDDDAVWRLGDVRRGPQAPRLGAPSCPEEGRAFAAAADAEGAVPWTDADPLEIHERWLGAAMPKTRSADLGELRDEDLSALPHARVRMTLLGLAGDAAISDPLWYLCHDLRPRQDAGLSRAYVRAVRRPVLAPPALFNAGAGLDARPPLPPFPPALRGEDSVFCTLLRRSFPGPITAHLPWVLPHRPPADRFLAPAFFATARPPVLGLISELSGREPLRGGAGGYDRLSALGSALRRWARPRGYESRLTELIHAWAKERRQWLLAAAAADTPLGRRHIRALERTAAQAAVIIPAGLPAGGARLMVGQAALGLGCLLADWEALCAAARGLSDRGVKPALRP